MQVRNENRLRHVCAALAASMLLLAGIPLAAQNLKPQVSNVNVTVDTVLKTVTITYDAADREGEQLDISIAVSADSGATFIVPVDNLTGSAGYPVTPGTGLQAVWTYDPAKFDMHGTGPNSFVLRVTANDRYSTDPATIIERIDSNRLRADIQMLQGVRHRSTGLEHLLASIDSIKLRLEMYGNKILPHDFTYGAYKATNIIGIKAGLVSENDVFYFTSHFDTVSGSPGADDNASAIAALFELARVMADLDFPWTVKFASFDLEEPGCAGSTRYCKLPSVLAENIRGLINFETFAFYSEQPNSQTLPDGFSLLFPDVYQACVDNQFKGDFVLSVGCDNSAPLNSVFGSAAAAYVPDLKFICINAPGTGALTPDLRRSDHAPFWDINVKAIQLTDAANFRNPNYHQATDVIETLNMSFASRVVKAALATLLSSVNVMHCGWSLSQPFGFDVTTSTEQWPAATDFALGQNSPNPAHDAAVIRIRVPHRSSASLKLYNTLGSEVTTLFEGTFETGTHTLPIDCSNLKPGVYFYRLAADGRILSRRMIVTR
jgi:Zn-dependent M28 family amino/carboxypeptidase